MGEHEHRFKCIYIVGYVCYVICELCGETRKVCLKEIGYEPRREADRDG
jgi:hypothetical protein